MNAISPASSVSFAKDLQEMTSGAEGAGKGGFSSFLSQSLTDVDHLLKAADQKNTEMAVGKTENLHEAMITVEKAETALKLMVQVRNKAMDAYHEVMRMQI